MANLKDIRTRIGSVKNTQQITRAMKMVSAAKLRRAQQNIVNLRPYAQRLLQVISDISVTHRVHHPLLSTSSSPKKVLMVVLTSDRGLCGGFNSNIGKFALNFYNKNKANFEKMDLFFIGTKGRDYFKFRGIISTDVMANLSKEVSFTLAAKVADRLMHDFAEGGYDSVYLIYNEFKSAISQQVVCETLLPVDVSKSNLDKGGDQASFSVDMIFEPQPEEMIDDLLKRHFATQVYRCMCESVAAEHGARMTSMENATKNAGEMISKLTLSYNKMRQASITTELTEITSGAEALKG
jgi:F-type H+-transporting ATPase subunit gamma